MLRPEPHNGSAALASEYRPEIADLIALMQRVVVGQVDLIESLIIALLTGGHVLIEGVPGLAKTLTAKTFARATNLSYERIQFTPDLLPADIIGSRIFNQRENAFEIIVGPIYANIVLADEINRAPQKVHSALLQAMAERQITIARTTISLPEPFMIVATQNPLESEGVYPLPEALLDRFLMKIVLPYPSLGDEIAIVKYAVWLHDNPPDLPHAIDKARVDRLRASVRSLAVHDSVFEYATTIVQATRAPHLLTKQKQNYVRCGAGPRGTIDLIQAARAYAFIHKRDTVTMSDIYNMAHPVLRHRIILSYEAIANGITVEQVINTILASVPRPPVKV